MPNPYPRILAEISRHQWAITQGALDGIIAAVRYGLTADDRELFHAVDEQGSLNAASQLGELLDGAKLARINGNVGSLFINGPLVPRASAFAESSGIVSVERMTSEFNMLADNPSVETILLVFDSPGGVVTGIDEYAKLISSSDKRVVAYVTGMAASAAYWIASAADTVVSAPTGLTGSIGTVFTVSAPNGDSDSIEIVSVQSPLKRVDPTTKEGKAELQKIPNGITDVFIAAVAKGRKTSIDTVANDFGRGASFIAAEALQAGMIDKIDTLANTMASLQKNDRGPHMLMAVEPKKEKLKMPNLQDLIAENHAYKAEFDALMSAARKDGAAKAKETHDKLVAHVMGVLSSDQYKKLHPMAMQCLKGDLTPDGLLGAVAAFDAITAANEVNTMQADTQDSLADVAAAAADKKQVVDANVGKDVGLIGSVEAANAEILEFTGRAK